MMIQKACERKPCRTTSISGKPLPAHERLWGGSGQEQEINEVMSLTQKVAHSNSTILIEGKRGTGKELIAHAIHGAQPAPGSFVHRPPLCCPARNTLQESELCGMKKRLLHRSRETEKRAGGLANRGICSSMRSEDHPFLQVKLLRFLETSKFRHLGGEQELQIDVRVIAQPTGPFKSMFRWPVSVRTFTTGLTWSRCGCRPFGEKRDIPFFAGYFLNRLAQEKNLHRRLS